MYAYVNIYTIPLNFSKIVKQRSTSMVEQIQEGYIWANKSSQLYILLTVSYQ